jgi:hypothetical protein
MLCEPYPSHNIIKKTPFHLVICLAHIKLYRNMTRFTQCEHVITNQSPGVKDTLIWRDDKWKDILESVCQHFRV